MKGNEITKDGFYWYRERPEHPWTVCLIQDGTFFYGCGADEFEDMPLAAGVLTEAEFVGPIEPPA